jgi:hypothetical protein
MKTPYTLISNFMSQTRLWLPALAMFASFSHVGLADPVVKEGAVTAPAKSGWVETRKLDIEGWPVYVDTQLLVGPHKEEGDRVLKMLANHLQRIAILVPEKQLADLRKLEIQIDRHHPTMKTMGYHPDVEWLVENGHDPKLVNRVHITRASDLVLREQMIKHPAVILHELAHAYHDQILGFEEPRVIEAYKNAMAKGMYEKCLLYDGTEVKHYGATDHKEYFAEATEAYFYRNDFFPFVRAELLRHDPEVHAVMEQIWGKIKGE